mmetsp:Transcript_15640/g.40285  ORF Transcript_15640/g.40285 Transcript_15640/m.40285 type:complete len:268 (+) Transcript_15640:490-1293(+)
MEALWEVVGIQLHELVRIAQASDIHLPHGEAAQVEDNRPLPPVPHRVQQALCKPHLVPHHCGHVYAEVYQVLQPSAFVEALVDHGPSSPVKSKQAMRHVLLVGLEQAIHVHLAGVSAACRHTLCQHVLPLHGGERQNSLAVTPFHVGLDHRQCCRNRSRPRSHEAQAERLEVLTFAMPFHSHAQRSVVGDHPLQFVQGLCLPLSGVEHCGAVEVALGVLMACGAHAGGHGAWAVHAALEHAVVQHAGLSRSPCPLLHVAPSDRAGCH